MTVIDAPAALDVTPLSPSIGAELGGLDLREPLTPAEVEAVRLALLRWKVVFFRDQHLTPEQHLAFARNFGDLEIHPFARNVEDHPELVKLHAEGDDRRAAYQNGFHSDVTWRAEPSLGSILRAVEVPPVGGDTVWCDMVAVYDGLPAEVRERIDPLICEHDFLRNPAFAARAADDFEAQRAKYPVQRHPLVRVHPETGQRVVYRGFDVAAEGLDDAEWAELAAFLSRQVTYPEYQVRFRWAPGSIAFWDNRSTQHYAVGDYAPHQRLMHRATVVGDRPFGIAEALRDGFVPPHPLAPSHSVREPKAGKGPILSDRGV